MLIVKVKENESIDRALRRYKKKVQRTGLIQEVRSNMYFEKPSKRRRNTIEKAKYKQYMQHLYEN